MSEIQALCAEHHVVRLDLFGSAARGDDFDPSTSDVDFLVSFESDASLDSLAELHRSLEATLGLQVDLLDRRTVQNPVIRKAILMDKVVLYAA